ncbi:MAG: helix-turn-helix domain-containing protein, partial [Chthoniobacteraceae bacterium]
MAGALAVFARQGIAATSIEDIVAEAGYTRGAFYSSFESLDDLVLSVIELHVSASMAQLEALTEQYPDPEQFIAELASRGGGQAAAPPGLTRLLGEIAGLPDDRVSKADLFKGLASAAAHPDAKVRAAAAWACGRIGSDAAADAATGVAREDADAHVRLIALLAGTVVAGALAAVDPMTGLGLAVAGL